MQTAIFREEMSVCAILEGLIRFLLRGQGNFPYHMVLMLPLCSVLFKWRAECHKILLIKNETKFSTPFAESSERGWQHKPSPNFPCSFKTLRTRIFGVPTFSGGGSVRIIYEEQDWSLPRTHASVWMPSSWFTPSHPHKLSGGSSKLEAARTHSSRQTERKWKKRCSCLLFDFCWIF